MSLQQTKTVDILGVKVGCITLETLFLIASKWIEQNQPRTIFYANAHVFNLAVQSPTFLSLLNQADLVYADGISASWASQFLYRIEIKKLTARAWIQDFARFAAQQRIKLFFFGGMQGVSQIAASHLRTDHPEIQIVGCKDGILSLEQEGAILEEINRVKPDILFVGLGSPLQEKWIRQNRTALNVPVCWAVGALFDYLAGRETPVPDWLDRLGFEWLWRLLMNPRGKWMRYLIGNPLFIWRVWLQRRKLSKI